MSVIRKTVQLCNFLTPERLSYFRPRIFTCDIRNYAASSNDAVSPSQKMEEILQKKFPKAKKIEVNDLSGGCGSMYEIIVETVEFKGLSLVKQHMLINQTLKDEIKSMHGLTVKTKIADAEAT